MKLGDREALVDAAFDVLERPGVSTADFEQVATRADFPTQGRDTVAVAQEVVLWVLDDLLTAMAAALADVPAHHSALEALLIANTNAVNDIINGRGVMTRRRLRSLARVTTASAELRQLASLRRKQRLVGPVAERLGIARSDPAVEEAVVLWSSVMAAAYNPVNTPVRPVHDGRVPEQMVARLHRTFRQITGIKSPRPGRPSL